MQAIHGSMNKTIFLSAFFALFSFVVAPEAMGQLNEKRIKRDATGRYQVVRKGGVAIFKGPGGKLTVTPPTIKTQIKIPITGGKVSTATRSDDYPGNGKATYDGKEKRTDVRRGGKLIKFKGVGKSDENDGFGIYKGSVAGEFKDKGSTWKTSLVKEGEQNQGGGNIKIARGMEIRGAD